MRFITILAVLILLLSCSGTTKKENKPELLDSLSTKTKPPQPVALNWQELKDTTINNIKLSFTPLDKIKFDSLQHLSVNTEIPYKDFKHLLLHSEKCQIIKIESGGNDSLCDIHDKSGYYEEYTIKGLWKEKNKLIVNSRNWENSTDFLMNLHDGSLYYLNDKYEISPSQSFILGFNIAIAVNGNDFMYSEITGDSSKSIFNIDFGQLVVTKLYWLTDTECILSAGLFESGVYEIKKDLYYLMTISR